jgi:hypothetical protein
MDNVDRAQEIEERHREAALARMRARIAATTPAPTPPPAQLQEDDA